MIGCSAPGTRSGMHPLFYADVGHTLLLSPAVETLLAHPGVSAEINRARLVDHLQKRWTQPDETYFTHVSRVPPGHIMLVGDDGRQVFRYWDPLPPIVRSSGLQMTRPRIDSRRCSSRPSRAAWR